MDVWLAVGMFWALCSLTLLLVVVAPTKNPDTGKYEAILLTPAPGDTRRKHVLVVTRDVLFGPITWLGLGISVWRDYRKKKRGSASFAP